MKQSIATDGLIEAVFVRRAERSELEDLRATILDRTASTPQVRSWRAWLVPSLRSPYVRAIGIAFVLGALLLAIGLTLSGIGSQHRLPLPFGPARNGSIVYDRLASPAPSPPYDAAADLYVAAADGTSARPLPVPGDRKCCPIWSPDGTAISYWSQADGSRAWSLTVVDGDGSNALAVAGAWPDVWQNGATVAWAPDSRRLAFNVPVDGREQIFVARREAASARPVGDPMLPADWPAWSPDGKTIAFRGGLPGSQRGVYLMDADGSNVRRLSHVTSLVDGDSSEPDWSFQPNWSPDGRSIAFAGPGAAGAPVTDIWVVSVDGTGERPITRAKVTSHIAPRWSPDGARLLFLRGDPSAGYRVVIVDADGSDERMLEGPVVDAWRPGWSPDGTHVVAYLPATFGVYDGHLDRLAIFDAVGDRPAQIVPLNGVVIFGADWQRLAP